MDTNDVNRYAEIIIPVYDSIQQRNKNVKFIITNSNYCRLFLSILVYPLFTVQRG